MTIEASRDVPSSAPDGAGSWYRVPDDQLPADGRVASVVVDGRSLAMSRCGGRLGALENRCPHQGGPLGDGSIEKGLLRCPWHGYDYDPITGRPPGGFDDAVPGFPVRQDADGTYVRLPAPVPAARSVADVVVATLVAFGVTDFFGMVGHSNLGIADALRRAEQRGEIRYLGIRHEGAAAFAASAYGKLTGRPAACLAIAGPGSTNLLTGLYDARLDGAPVIAISGQVPSNVLGRGAFQDLDLSSVFADVAVSSVTMQAGSNHAELAALAVKHAIDGRGVAHLVLPDEVQVQPSEAPAAVPAGRLSGPAGTPPAARRPGAGRDAGRTDPSRPDRASGLPAPRPRIPLPVPLPAAPGTTGVDRAPAPAPDRGPRSAVGRPALRSPHARARTGTRRAVPAIPGERAGRWPGRVPTRVTVRRPVAAPQLRERGTARSREPTGSARTWRAAGRASARPRPGAPRAGRGSPGAAGPRSAGRPGPGTRSTRRRSSRPPG